MSADEYELRMQPPCLEDYLRLRALTGLSPKTPEAARLGLAGTYFGVTVLRNGTPVGMGRAIGDGGCFFQIVDIAVLPEHQGRGLGKRIMETLVAHLRLNAPSSAYVSLLADGKAQDLYRQFGFKLSAPASVGMCLTL
jgi:ribosomal protein S18 acetylase RimI-like enzyme